MLLSVDDFGCVPDGRYFPQVSVQAGFTELAVADGGLRPTDVGKHIAVPGAVDLDATVVGLVDRKDVAQASMTAGSATLIAQLTAADGFFRADRHEGQRITIVGAGPQGATLTTDVSTVTNRTTLELADVAATTVTDTTATLNRRDRVALSDYARATAENVTVDLVDRVASDIRMTVGRRRMESSSAAFSSEDLLKSVTVPGAGRLVTTIEGVTSDTVAILGAPAQRDVTDGPADVWRTDSRPGFENLLAELENLDVESADIRFGPGVYDFTRVPKATGELSAALGLDGVTNLRLWGAGPGVTVLRLMPDQDLHGPDSHVIQARNCRKLTMRDLTVNGSYLTMAAVNEQMHGIVLSEGCRDVVLERVEVFQSAGDGIRLVGASANKVGRVWLDGCRLVQNKRTGIAFQRAAEFVWVRDCYVEMTPPSTDACIDFEPTGSSASTDVVIDSNVLVHDTEAQAVSLSGISGTDPARRIRFTNNMLQGGVIGGVHAQDVTVSGNTIVGGDRGDVMVFRGTFDGLRVENNKLVATGAQQDGIRVARTDGFVASGIRVNGNDIDVPGVGIELVDVGNHVEVRGNRILGQGVAVGIKVALDKPPEGAAPTVEVRRDVRIVSNTITNFGDAGIHLATADTVRRIDGLEIGGNQLDVDATAAPTGLVGVRIPRPGHGTDRWLTRAVVSGNRIADAVGEKIQRDGLTVPFLAVSGNPGGPVILEGDGNPNQIGVPAPPGSLFLQVDDQTSAALYLKASGTGGTGWIEMAQSST
jgi:hypothetical protein